MSESPNKIWICEYDWHGAYGSYEQRTLIVNAGSKTEAFGIALMSAEDSIPSWWTIEEFSPESSPREVHWASS